MNWFCTILFLQLLFVSIHCRPENLSHDGIERKLSSEIGDIKKSDSHQHLSANVEIEMPDGMAYKRLLPLKSFAKKIDVATLANVSPTASDESTEKHFQLVSMSPTSSATSAATVSTAATAQEQKSTPSTTMTTTTSTTTVKKAPVKQATRVNNTVTMTKSELPKTRYNSSESHLTQPTDNHLNNSRNSLNTINRSDEHSATINRNLSTINDFGIENSKNSTNDLTSSRQMFPVFVLPPSPDSDETMHPQIFQTEQFPVKTDVATATATSIGINRQYVYNVHSFVSSTAAPTLGWNFAQATPSPIESYRPVTPHQLQQSPVLLSPQNYFTSFGTIQQQPMLNVESSFNALPTPHSVSYQNQNIQTYIPKPPLFHGHVSNITRLHSIITTTHDPYRYYEKVQTRPIMTRRKVMKIHVTTPYPLTASTTFPKFTVTILKKNDKKVNGNNKKPNDKRPTNNKNANANKNQTKNSQENHKANGNQKPNQHANGNKGGGGGGENKLPNKGNNKNANANKKNDKKPMNGEKNKQQQTSADVNSSSGGDEEDASITNKLKLSHCDRTVNASDFRNENVCGAGDLKIIIKFDGDTLNTTRETLRQEAVQKNTAQKNATTKNQNSKVRNGKDQEDYDERDDVDIVGISDDGKWEYYYEDDEDYEPVGELKAPGGNQRRRQRLRRKRVQNRFNRRPSGNDRINFRLRKKQDRMKFKLDKRPTDENHYQTIVLQSPPTPMNHKFQQFLPQPTTMATITTTEADPYEWKRDWLLRFISYMPFLTLLKPLSFGFWIIVLSPLLVVGATAIGLGVALYPWLTLSKEHAAHTAIKRPPTIVIHKHPHVRGKEYPSSPVTLRYAKPTFSHQFLRRSLAHASDENRRRRRRRKRHASLFTGKYTYSDIDFRHWLLVKNNFEIRHLTWNDLIDGDTFDVDDIEDDEDDVR